MREYKVGDRVRFTSDAGQYFVMRGEKGTIRSVRQGATVLYGVRWDNGRCGEHPRSRIKKVRHEKI